MPILKNIPVWSTLFLSLLVAVFLSKTLFGGQVFVTPDFGRSDILHLNYPIKFFLSESLKRGEWPLWNPYNATGYPQLAEGQMGTFNPENLLVFGFLTMPLAFNIGLALIFFQTGIFTYLFARSIGLSRIAAFFSSVAFSYSGVFATHIVHFNLIQTLSFFPLQLYLTELFFQKRKLYLLPLLSIVTAIQIFSGFYQVAVYSIIATTVYALFKIYVLKASKVKKLFLLLLFTLTLTLTLTLSAIQLLPSFELAQLSGRSGGVSYSEMNRFPLNPKHLLTFLNPYLFGDPRQGTYPIYSSSWGIFWESTGYLGILPLIFAALAIIFLVKKNRHVQFFTLLLFLSLLLALGKYSPTFFLFEFPPLNLFRVPARWIMFLTFSLAILGGFGFDFIYQKLKTKNLKLILGGLALIIATFDLLYFGMNYNAIGKAKEWLSPPQTFEFLSKDQSFYRTITFGQGQVWNSFFLKKGWQGPSPYQTLRNGLDPDSNLPFHLPNFWVYESIVPDRNQMINNIIDQDLQIKDGYLSIGDKAKKILSLLGVKYLISTAKVEDPDLKEVFTTQTIPVYFIYQNSNALPLVFLPQKTTYAQTYEELEEILENKDFDPKATAILKTKLPKEEFDSPQGKAEITKVTNTKITINANILNDQLLVLNESFYPGWKASDNGEKLEILAANGNQQAVYLEKGNHQIEFCFQPESFRKGQIVTLISLVIILAGFLLARRIPKSLKRTALFQKFIIFY